MSLLRKLFSGGSDSTEARRSASSQRKSSSRIADHSPTTIRSNSSTPADLEQAIRGLVSEDRNVRLAAVEALGTVGVPRAIPALISVLKDREKPVRQGAATALSKCGASALEPLLKELKSPDKYSRLGATVALTLLKDDSQAFIFLREPRITDSIIEALVDEDTDVRSNAAIGLGLIGDTRAVPPLITALAHGDLSAAATALGMLKDSRGVEPLIAALRSPNESTRKSAAYSLGKIGGTHAIEALTVVLNDTSEDVRKTAAKALTTLGIPTNPPPADGGVLHDATAWKFKCEHLGEVIACNEHGAFALNRAKKQLWLATPETAFQVNTSAFAGDHAYAIGALHAVWDAKCKGKSPITEESFQQIRTVFG